MGLGDWLVGTGKAVIKPINKLYEADTPGIGIGTDELLGKSGALGKIAQGLNAAYEADIPLIGGGADEALGHSGLGGAANKAMAGLDWLYTYGFSRPLTTALITDDWGDDWGESWRASKNISPAQAFVAGLGNKTGDISRATGIDPGLMLHAAGGLAGGAFLKSAVEPTTGVNFDIRDEEDREVFRSGAPMIMSGALDAVARWYMDPLVIGGKAAKVGRENLLEQRLKVKPGETSDEFSARLDQITGDPGDALMRVPKLDRRGNVVKGPDGKTVYHDIPAERGGKRLDKYATFFMGMDEKARRNALLRDRNLRDQPAVAEFLTRADTEREFKLRMRVVMHPSMRNLQFLEDASLRGAQEYRALTDVRLQGLETSLRQAEKNMELAENPAAWNEARENTNALTREVRDMRREVERSRNEHDDLLLMAQSGGMVDNVPRVTLGQRAAERYRKSEIGGRENDWWVYQPNRFSAVRVLRSATTRRAGVVSHDNPAEAIDNITRMFDRTGHGLGVGLNQGVRDAHITAVTKAATTGSIPELEKAIQAAEKAVFQHIGKTVLVPKGKTEEQAADIAEALYQDFVQRRYTTQVTLMNKGRERIGSSAYLDETGQPIVDLERSTGIFSGGSVLMDDGRRKFFDMVENIDGVLEHHPLANTMLENATPLVDVDALTRLVRREANNLVDEGDNLVAQMKARAGGSESGFVGAREVSDQLLTALNNTWKPAQLLRLGWPMRVVVDESMRSMAVLGVLNHLSLQGHSLGNSLAQGALNYKFRDLATSARRRRAEAEAATLGRQVKLGQRLQGGLVDEIVYTLQKDGELVARHQELRTKLDEAIAAIGPEPEEPLTRAQAMMRERRIERDIVPLEDQLDEILEQRLELGALRLEHTGKRDKLNEVLAALEEDYAAKRLEARAPSERTRGDEKRPRKFAGSLTYTVNGVTITYQDALGGNYGRIFGDLASAQSTFRALANTNERYLNRLRLVGGDTAVLKAVIPPNLPQSKARLLKETYDSGWMRAVNEQIGQDVMLRQILQGKSTDEITAWMNNTTEGQEYIRKADQVRAARKEEWIEMARSHIDHYLPSDELKALALEGKATRADLDNWNKGRIDPDTGEFWGDAGLPAVHAQSLDLVVGQSEFSKSYSRIVDNLYAKIGTAPTDVLSRHPFFAGVYRNEMRRQFDRLMLQPGDEVPPSVIARLERNARQKALREVKSTLYDVANESNLGHTLRFVFPFYSAWEDALRTWGRLWLNDPSILARQMQVWQAPQKTPGFFEDENGEKYVSAKWSKPILEKLGVDADLAMPAEWMKELIFNGEYWYNPGLGVPVTVPVAAIVRDRPDLYSSLEPVLPYGAGDEVLDQVLPAGWKRMLSLNKATDDEDYAKAQWRLFQDVYTKRRLDGDDVGSDQAQLEMWNEAKRRTDALFTVRMASNFALPFSPGVRSPYQYYIDRWTKIQEEYRANPDAFGGKSAQDYFIDTEGEEYFIFTLAATKSNVGGIAPTEAGYKGFNQYRDLVRQMPEMGSLIVGDTTGEYSPAVAQWMLDEGIGGGDPTKLRDIRDPRQGLIDAQVNRGWAKFRQIDNLVDAALADIGEKNLRSNRAKPIKLVRDLLIDQIKKEMPHWAADYGNFDRTKADRRVAFMETLIEAPGVMERPGYRSLAQYLAARKTVVQALAERKSAGGSADLQAEVNTDLRTVWDLMVGQLRQDDTAFSDLHTRWLHSDDLDTGGVV